MKPQAIAKGQWPVDQGRLAGVGQALWRSEAARTALVVIGVFALSSALTTVVRTLFFYGFPRPLNRVYGFLGQPVPDLPNGYTTFSPLAASVQEPTSFLALAAVVAAFVLVMIRSGGTGGWPWYVRAVPGVAAAVLAWDVGLADYNFYFDQWYPLERVLVVVCAALTFWSPSAALPTMALWYLLSGQVNDPIPLSSMVDKTLPLAILACSFSLIGIQAIRSGWTPADWTARLHAAALPSFLAIVAAYYFWPGFAKLWLDPPNVFAWITLDVPEVQFINLSSRRLRNISPFSKDELAVILNPILRVGMASVLLLELLGIVVFLRRRLAVALLVGCALFNGMSLVAFGLLFWKWMAVCLVLAIAIAISGRERNGLFDLDGLKNRVTSAVALGVGPVLILGAVHFFDPPPLGWFNTPHYQWFEWEVQGRSGTQYHVDKDDFAPYHMWLSFDRLYYLDPEPLLADQGSTQDPDVARALQEAQPDGGDVEELKVRFGRPLFNSAAVEQTREFIATFVCRRYLAGWPQSAFGLAGAPKHVVHEPLDPVWAGQEEPVLISVRILEAWFNEKTQHATVTRNEVLLEVDLTQHAACQAGKDFEA